MNLDKLLAELREQRFYGSLEIKFEAGKVALMRKTQTIRPEPDHASGRQNKGDNDHESRH